MLTDAVRFAVEAHEGQKRKGSGLPYIVHPLEVMQILLRHGVEDEETLVAAFLHDALEDTAVTIEAVRERYGERVAAIVAAVTKPAEGRRSSGSGSRPTSFARGLPQRAS